jgi:hypothetical protein
MVLLLRSFVRGPLEPYVAGFADELARSCWLSPGRRPAPVPSHDRRVARRAGQLLQDL